MTTRQDRSTMEALLAEHGRTFADEAGIRLRDTPSPLYRLVVLALLLSAPIGAKLAVAAARELARDKLTTPRAMLDASWQQRVDALGRAHYRRYDEQTATALGDGARLVRDEYGGDLRRLRRRADGSPDRIRRELTRLPRIGPTGAAIFCREAQGHWPELRPFFDTKALAGASAVGLPHDADALAALSGGERLPVVAAALVRVGLDRKAAERVRERAR